MADEKNSSTIDFSKSSQSELLAALGRINRDEFPANYEACKAEIQKRKAEGQWSEASSPSVGANEKRPLFSLKRRFFSYLLDGIFIALVSLAFFPLSGVLNQIGFWGVIPFWLLNFAYGTLLDGSVGGGQTFGKKITNLKVVGENGAILSWSQASIRGIYFAVLVGMLFGMYGFFPESIFAKVLNFLLFAFFVFNILFVLKHPQNRSLVDLISNTLVHDTDYPTPSFIGFSAMVNFKAWIAAASIFVVGFSCFGLFFNPLPAHLNADSYRADIEANTNLKYAGIGTFKNYSNGQLRAFGTNYTFWLSPEYLSDQNFVQEQTKKAREILMANVPPTTETGVVNVIVGGYVFKGLLPTSYVYRNFDMKKEPANP